MTNNSNLLNLIDGLLLNYGTISIRDLHILLKRRYNLSIENYDMFYGNVLKCSSNSNIFTVKDGYVYIAEIRDVSYLNNLQREYDSLDYKYISYIEVIECAKKGRPLNVCYKDLYQLLENTLGIPKDKIFKTIEYISISFQLNTPPVDIVQQLVEFNATKIVNDIPKTNSIFNDFLQDLPQWSLKGFSINDLNKEDETKITKEECIVKTLYK